MARKKPEVISPPELYYDSRESNKYHNNSRINKIQRDITDAAVRLLNLDDNTYIIADIGCGSGISSEILTNNKHQVIGLDISNDMLNINIGENVLADLINIDIGKKDWPLRDECFDYAISISTLQWLLFSFDKKHDPKIRLFNFFSNLYRVVKYSAVIQYYPPKEADNKTILMQAKKTSFFCKITTLGEGKNKKYFIVLIK